MTEPVFRRYTPADRDGVIACILAIQQGEYGMAITAQDQPDLADIPAFYQNGAGDFRVAEAARRIVGTIALKDFGGGEAALRKMFVAADYRGRERGVAARLLAELLDHAKAAGLRALYLGTTEHFVAAHRFYERAGFTLIAAGDLPARFPRMAVDTRFYRLMLE